jgi:ribosomal protein S27E
MKAKVAKFRRLEVFELQCPECGEAIEGPTGSVMHVLDDLTPGQEISCQECGTVSLVPKRAPRSGR